MMLPALLLAFLPQISQAVSLLGGATDPGGPGVAAVAEPSTPAPTRDPFATDTVFRIGGGPRVVKLGTPGSEVVAMRLSIPFQEGGGEVGGGRLLQLLALERTRSRATAAGVTLEGTRTPWGLAYTVVGTGSDFDLLALLIRDAVAESRAGDGEFERLRLSVRSEALRLQETPGARLSADLRSRAAPGSPRLDGTPSALDRITRAGVQALWARTHRPEAMTLIVAGEVPHEVLLSAFGDMGAPSGPPEPAPGGSVAALDQRGTQVFRHWLGHAYVVADPRDPHASVAALLTADWLRGESQAFESDVQLWEMADRKVITVVASAYPGQAVRMRSRLPTALANTRQSLTSQGVAEGVARIRQDLLFRARTPAGLVTVLGRHMDATGEATAVRQFLDSLDRVTLDSTRSFFSRMEGQAPLRVEVRP